MNITGTIIVLGETKSFGASGFRKREFVIETDEQYKQTIPVEMVQDKCDILNNYTVGDIVSVSINLRGNSWVNPKGETKYFPNIQGWRIEKTDAPQQEPQMEAPDLTANEPDSLPF